MEKIIIGPLATPLYTFTDAEIDVGGVKMNTAVDLVGSELTIDTLTAVINYASGAYILFSPSDYDGILVSDGHHVVALHVRGRRI